MVIVMDPPLAPPEQTDLISVPLPGGVHPSGPEVTCESAQETVPLVTVGQLAMDPLPCVELLPSARQR